MTPAELHASLTDEQKAALASWIRAEVKVAEQRGRDSNSWAAMFRGMAKSWSCWLGWFLLVAYPTVEPTITPIMIDVFGDTWSRKVLPIIGAMVLILRMKTTESLEKKGATSA